MKKIIAQEWLKLIIGIIVGLIVVTPFVYTFLSPESYTTSHTLSYAYEELFEMLFDNSIKDRPLAWSLVLAPYFIYQFLRSLVWAYKASK
ncbi:MAG: hypothetical protein COB26_10200 [Piscirickettsiaceae bacterium]|nr:MAG: hypothetical protein COB26_10200 [Piscirickettsiaceae bacterium]